MSNTGYINVGVQRMNELTIHQIQNPINYRPGGQTGNQKAVFTQQFWLNPPWGRPRDINYPELEEYENNAWVRMVITHIIDSVVQCDYNIKSIKEKDIDQTTIDEATDFFSSRTWTESWKETLRRLLPDLLLYDCGVLVKVFPDYKYDEDMQFKGKAKPLELVCRDGRSFLKNTDLFGYTDKFFQYSWISPQARPVSFARDEIIYMQMRPQSRSPYGISTLEIVKSIVDYLTASVNANRKYWENGMFIGGQIDHHLSVQYIIDLKLIEVTLVPSIHTQFVSL